MADELRGRRVAILAADGVEQVEAQEAHVVRGRTLTSFPSIHTDIRNSGGNVVDHEVVIDQGLVTSRDPNDLPAFCSKIVEEFTEARH